MPDGTEAFKTAAIARGYKDGYGIIETGDQRITVTNAGTGGNGATGGLAADGTTDGGEEDQGMQIKELYLSLILNRVVAQKILR